MQQRWPKINLNVDKIICKYNTIYHILYIYWLFKCQFIVYNLPIKKMDYLKCMIFLTVGAILLICDQKVKWMKTIFF